MAAAGQRSHGRPLPAHRVALIEASSLGAPGLGAPLSLQQLGCRAWLTRRFSPGRERKLNDPQPRPCRWPPPPPATHPPIPFVPPLHQASFYDKVAIRCWSEAIVPNFVTSNAFIANCYARNMLAFIRDWFLR